MKTEVEKKASRLIADLCANYYQGSCLPIDCDCAQVNSLESLKEGKCICLYFAKAVLPADKELYRAITNNRTDQKTCIRCRGRFTPANNRQQYCLACRDAARRKNDAARKRQNRYSYTV
jgi:hypothetical protein